MKNNTEKIDQYLSGEMNPAEKAAFESLLLQDADLRKEMEMQQAITGAAVDAGIKTEFANAMPVKNIFQKPITWIALAAACILAFILYNFSNSLFPLGHNDSKTNLQQLAQSIINPPLPAIDVPFFEYQVNAEKADTIVYPSGSVICFPSNSMIDAAGNPVKGTVKIRYREFADPLDFFVSGIPMNYDSAGVKYNFESSGMCEIQAFQNNKPVFVNPHAKPVVNLASKNADSRHNLYQLDTVSGKWNYVGKDVITKLERKRTFSPGRTSSELGGMPVKPVKPVKASGDHPVFSIEVDPGSFEELFAYDRLKFEVVDESTYKASDASEHWDSVQLTHTSTEGIYNVTFKNSKRQVRYTVRPVLEGEDYDAAMKVFSDKEAAFQKAKQSRLAVEKAVSDSIDSRNKAIVEKIKQDSAWNEMINNVVAEGNRKMREIKKQTMDELEKANALNRQSMENQLAVMEMYEKRNPTDGGKTSIIIRSFRISGFGVWNCDCPETYLEVPIFASFVDTLQQPVAFSTVSVVYPRINGIRQFAPGELRLLPDQKNMMWAIHDQKFYYNNYQDFAAMGNTAISKAVTFKMRIGGKNINSYKEIRELVERDTDQILP